MELDGPPPSPVEQTLYVVTGIFLVVPSLFLALKRLVPQLMAWCSCSTAQRSAQRQKYIMQQSLLQKKALCRKLALLYCFNGNTWYASTCLSFVSESRRWTTMPAAWIGILLGFTGLAISHLPDRYLDVDLAHVFWQLLVTFILSPWGIVEVGTSFVMFNFVMFLFVTIPSACCATRISLVFLMQTGVTLLVIFRTMHLDDEQQSLVYLNLAFLPSSFLAMYLAKFFLALKVEAKIREQDTLTELQAVSSLLGLTCEAVLELDAELKLTNDTPHLAAMLLRPAALKGQAFTDFVASEHEAQLAQEVLLDEQGPSQPSARVFHTRLVDSCRSKFRTEVFQVKYTRSDGERRHLIGLRDYTDLKSLTAPEESLEAEAIAQLPSESSSRLRSQSPGSNMSITLAGSRHSGLRRAQRNGVVEKRLYLGHKEAFLEVDLEEQVVSMASAPYSHLAGTGLRDVFVHEATVELMWRLRQDALAFVAKRNDPERLPDQVASFKHMPLTSASDTVEISGRMKTVLTRQGAMRVMLCFGLCKPAPKVRL